MAWSSPVTHSTGDNISAANWNAEVTNNQAYLHSVPAGSMFAGNFSILNASWLNPTFAAEWTANGMTFSSNRLVVPQTGLYLAHGEWGWSLPTTAQVGLEFTQNSSNYVLQWGQLSGGAVVGGQSFSWIAACSASDQCTLSMWQQSSTTTIGGLRLTMTWIGDS